MNREVNLRGKLEQCAETTQNGERPGTEPPGTSLKGRDKKKQARNMGSENREKGDQSKPWAEVKMGKRNHAPAPGVLVTTIRKVVIERGAMYLGGYHRRAGSGGATPGQRKPAY